MKKLILISFFITVALQVRAESSYPSDCIEAIRAMFQLQNSETDAHLEGESCGLSIRYSISPRSLSHKTFRRIDFVPMEIEDSKMSPVLKAELQDNTNVLTAYSVERCQVSDAGIDLLYTARDNFGSHRDTKSYNFTFWTQNGRVIGMSSNSNQAKNYSCRFR